jgi:putative membrane protein
MALRTLFLGLKGRFADHRAVARFTFPVWLYVSVTGVLVYLLLYQVAPRVA